MPAISLRTESNFGGHNKLRSGAVIPFSKVYQEGLCCRVNAQNLGKYTDGYFNNVRGEHFRCLLARGPRSGR